MSKSNLRTIMDAFADNVKNKIPADLNFDGKRLRLSTKGKLEPVAITSDLTDDTAYRIHGDDIEDVAEELGKKLTAKESTQIRETIGDGFSDSWHDVVEGAINSVIALRKED